MNIEKMNKKMNKERLIGCFLLLVMSYAVPLQAQQSCPVCGGRPIHAPQVCCSDQIIDPTKKTTVSVKFDFTALFNAIAKGASAFQQVTGTGLSWKPQGQSLQASFSDAEHEECCSNAITWLDNMSLSGNIQLGGIQGTLNCLPAVIPAWVVQAGFQITASGALSFKGASLVSTCSNPQVCINLTGATVSGTLLGYVSVESGVIQISGGGYANGTGQIQACVQNKVLTLNNPSASLQAGWTGNYKVGPVSGVLFQVQVWGS